jgi:hypothetical protein
MRKITDQPVSTSAPRSIYERLRRRIRCAAVAARDIGA